MMLSVIGVFYLHRACIRDIHNKAREVDNSDRSIPLWAQLETNTPFFPPFFNFFNGLPSATKSPS